MPITDKLKERVKKSEGWRDQLYVCPEGKLTIGYGFNVEDTKMPRAAADLWLDILLKHTKEALEKCEYGQVFKDLSESRQGVLIDMAYNLGLTGLLRFKKMWYALSEGEYESAAVEMLDSRWARQVGKRATELSTIMETNIE